MIKSYKLLTIVGGKSYSSRPRRVVGGIAFRIGIVNHSDRIVVAVLL